MLDVQILKSNNEVDYRVVDEIYDHMNFDRKIWNWDIAPIDLNEVI